jgi:hypothetical protein
MSTVEITWRGTTPVSAASLADDIEWAHDNGYTVHEWMDVNAQGDEVTMTRIVSPLGYTFALYEHTALPPAPPESFDRIDSAVPQTVLNAVIVAVMLDETYSKQEAQTFASSWFGYEYCDMTPVVKVAIPGPTDPEYCPDDLWYVEVQYSTKGARAGYGVNANHVPRCYVN